MLGGKRSIRKKSNVCNFSIISDFYYKYARYYLFIQFILPNNTFHFIFNTTGKEIWLKQH